jgi:anti-sigma factor RsiW
MNHIVDNHEALLDYLYEEGDPADRLKIRQHLQECATCSVAMLEFQSVRGMLSDWAPPPAKLGFRVVQDAPSASFTTPTQTWRRWVPQAAAAILLFVAGMAVSQLRVDYGDGALTVRSRSAAPGAPAAARNASITLPAQTVNTAASYDVNELKRELLGWLESQNAPAADTERLFQRVRTMIDQSEQRQQRELALRLSQVSREVDTQHQADVLRIQQEFGQQQDALEYLVRTSGGVK